MKFEVINHIGSGTDAIGSGACVLGSPGSVVVA